MLAMRVSLVAFLSLTLHAGGDTTPSYRCHVDDHGSEYCEATSKSQNDDDDEGPVFVNYDSLVQWDPVEVGHKRIVEVAEGWDVTMLTLAVDPPIFRIDDFLTDKESQHIVKKANKTGLFSSGLFIDKKINETRKKRYAEAGNDLRYFKNYDTNNDSEITIAEIKAIAIDQHRLYLTDDDVKAMIELLGMRELDDHVITRDEFDTQTSTGDIDAHFRNLRENHPRHRDRFSDQTWIGLDAGRDKILTKLRDKVTKLTRLPEEIVRGGERMQVLRYGEHGHYNAHYDSQDAKNKPDSECCHFKQAIWKEETATACRICRFITIVYYLSDVEEGGETAFPIADATFINKTELIDRGNLSEYCHNATVVVRPRRNTAVMWYNHKVGAEGWLGGLNYKSVHGGCVVKKGEKWLANNWLVAPPFDKRDRESVFME